MPNRVRALCKWVESDNNEVVRIMDIMNNTLYETNSNNGKVRNIGHDGRLKTWNTLSGVINIRDMFDSNWVPGICLVSSPGFEKHCTFPRIQRNKFEAVEEQNKNTKNVSLYCCTTNKTHTGIWYYNGVRLTAITKTGPFPLTFKDPWPDTVFDHREIVFVCGNESGEGLEPINMAKFILAPMLRLMFPYLWNVHRIKPIQRMKKVTVKMNT